METEVKPQKISNTALLCIGLAAGSMILAYHVYRRPYREIRKYKCNGRIQKPRIWYRKLRKRNKRKNQKNGN